MPSMMIHLLAAHRLDMEPDALFCVGTVAPDAVKAREDKDKTHFRIECDREEALINLARKTAENDLYGEGVLLHLFLDWLWDDRAYRIYSEKHKENGWFFSYRNEIAKAGSFIYHNYNWSKNDFRKMLSCPTESYGRTPGASVDEVSDMIQRNYIWHNENNIGPSEVFTPEFVEKFADNAVDEYKEWRRKINKSKILNNMGA